MVIDIDGKKIELNPGVDELTYEAVIYLSKKPAGDNYTITYRSTGMKKYKGMLSHNHYVRLVEPMIFKVSNTGNA